MKTIREFIENQNQLDFEIIRKITGGSGEVTTSSSEIVKDSCGSCQQVNTTDSFNDCNNNGIWDPGESGTSTSTYQKVDCPTQ